MEAKKALNRDTVDEVDEILWEIFVRRNTKRYVDSLHPGMGSKCTTTLAVSEIELDGSYCYERITVCPSARLRVAIKIVMNGKEPVEVVGSAVYSPPGEGEQTILVIDELDGKRPRVETT